MAPWGLLLLTLIPMHLRLYGHSLTSGHVIALLFPGIAGDSFRLFSTFLIIIPYTGDFFSIVKQVFETLKAFSLRSHKLPSLKKFVFFFNNTVTVYLTGCQFVMWFHLISYLLVNELLIWYFFKVLNEDRSSLYL